MHALIEVALFMIIIILIRYQKVAQKKLFSKWCQMLPLVVYVAFNMSIKILFASVLIHHSIADVIDLISPTIESTDILQIQYITYKNFNRIKLKIIIINYFLKIHNYQLRTTHTAN